MTSKAKLLFILITLGTLTSYRAEALVDMNNAGYTNAWLDLEVPGGGYNMRVVRAYKSRTLFNGIFGFGWCSPFETSLETTAEGNIQISECGDGMVTHFSSRDLNRKEVDTTISLVLTKMKTTGNQATKAPEYWNQVKERLLEDSEFRSAEAKKYGIAAPIKEGARLYANGKEVESVVLEKGYYTRTLVDGTSQRFSLQGRLTHMYDKNGNFLKFEYDKDLIKEVVDNTQRKLAFKYFPNKKVKQITGPGGLITEYNYSQQEDLIWNRNAWAQKKTDVYNYEYNEFHNLVKVTWPDKTFIALRYDNTKDWVIGFTDRDKCVESYKYETSTSNPKFHYWSTVIKTCEKKVVANNRYEFWHKQLDSGKIILSRVLQNVDGSTTDITYHDTFGKPVLIKRNNERLAFEYFPDGLIKIKEASNVKIEFSHDSSVKKVTSVKTTFINDKGKVIGQRFTNFKYDTKGNLSFAENSDGQKINMTYDNRGRIATITDQAKKTVKIDYDERFGKPAIVTRPGLGTIKVAYKQNGDISKVDSAEGPTVASQVASAFNNLLDVISPATQELYL